MTELVKLELVDESSLSEIQTLSKELSSHHPSPSIELLQRIARNPDYEFWTVQDDEKIIGMGIVIIIFETIGISALIEDVIVSEEYRGKGLGKVLLQKLITRAQMKGARH